MRNTKIVVAGCFYWEVPTNMRPETINKVARRFEIDAGNDWTGARKVAEEAGLHWVGIAAF